MVLLEQIQTVNKDELRDYIGTIEDEQLLRRINITLKKTFGLWIYKEEKKENIRCLQITLKRNASSATAELLFHF